MIDASDQLLAACAQLSGAVGLSISGCSKHRVDGTFGPQPSHAGWPRFSNEHGYQLYYCVESQAWMIGSEFEPEDEDSSPWSSVASPSGELPMGLHRWDGGSTEEGDDDAHQQLIVSFIASVDLPATMQQAQESKAAQEAAMAQAVAAQLTGVGAITVQRCPKAFVNGTFAPVGAQHFKNEHDFHLYFHKDDNEWVIDDAYSPDESGKSTWATCRVRPEVDGCPAGTLPVNQQ